MWAFDRQPNTKGRHKYLTKGFTNPWRGAFSVARERATLQLLSGTKEATEVMDTILRFLIGGLVVSVFAILGDMIKPESLGGVFAAAPTIAFATLSLTLHKHGAAYIAI